ncbi:MAG: VPLPA-CTERM sorting domain-containing protein [Spongiibacteraceae bacterium]|jgi:hypothetical protein|nr:VPLPA-CTERM sorting domain-containing protein [Spongiibacteraceae bacterium]
MRHHLLPALGAVLLICSPIVSAAVIPTVTFTTPNGTVGPTDTIEVWVTLTLDPTSDPLTFDANSPDPLKGLPSSMVPTEGLPWDVFDAVTFAPFASYTKTVPAFYTNCSSSVGNNYCVSHDQQDAPYYRNAFNHDPITWFNTQTLNLAPGEPGLDILLYQLTPTNGVTAPGHYALDSLMIGFVVFGLDEHGTEIFALIDFRCDTCSFVRTVSEVPVPAAVWLFGSALLGLAGSAKRHRK